MSVTPSTSQVAFAHTVPLGCSANEHVPFAGLHTPAISHALAARQVTAFPGWHLPAESHASLAVQALLSALQAVALARLVQVPSFVATLHATQSVVEPAPQAV